MRTTRKTRVFTIRAWPAKAYNLAHHGGVKIRILLVALVLGPIVVDCGGTTPIPSLPPPEYERPVVSPWDAGISVDVESVPSSSGEDPDAGD